MIPGSIFFDSDFHFHDGASGKKLFVVLGGNKTLCLVAKTTSRPYGKGIDFGCQPNDRFHNFHLPVNSCFLNKNTWICLDEFYELNHASVLSKHFAGTINRVGQLEDAITQGVQECALQSDDITSKQELIIRKSKI